MLTIEYLKRHAPKPTRDYLCPAYFKVITIDDWTQFCRGDIKGDVCGYVENYEACPKYKELMEKGKIE